MNIGDSGDGCVAAFQSLPGSLGRRLLWAPCELCPTPFQVQGVGSKGWRDVTTFFSGRAEDPSDRYARSPVLMWPLPWGFLSRVSEAVGTSMGPGR